MILFRHFKRYRHILLTLARHGLGWLMIKMGLVRFVRFYWRMLGRKKEEGYSAPAHLRMAFEELGVTFIKMAQILSTRPDLISPAYADELALLLDEVPPLPFEEIRKVLDEELERPFEEVFPEFEKTPVASASIGQVYRATMVNGRKVVVKIQRPNIRQRISEDMDILRDFVDTITKRTELGETYDLMGFLSEFSFYLTNELDYIREGQNADQFRAQFQEEPRIYIPKIYWEYTTARVLVMEEIRGIKVNRLDDAENANLLDRKAIAEAAVDITFQEIFKHGYFHADPHPGNFVIRDDQTLGLMDFGMVGYLDNRKKEAFIRFIYQMVKGETEEMLDAMWDLGMAGKFSNRPALKRDMNHLLQRFKGRSMGEIAAGEFLRELMGIAYRHQVYFPPDLALLLKVLMMSEGLGAMIDPEFNFFGFAGPYLKNLYRDLFSPENLAKKAQEDVVHLLQLANGLPKRLSHLLQRLELGDIQFTARHAGLERDVEQVYSAVDRLTISILLTLFLIALGIYILAGHFMGFGFFLVHILLALFVISGFVTLRILYNILRQKKFRIRRR